MSSIRFGRPFLVGFIVLIALAPWLTRPVAAAGLNPLPPGPARCQTTGQGTICQGSKPLVYTDPNGLLGLTCNGSAIIETGNGILTYTVFYNQDGNATRALLHAERQDLHRQPVAIAVDDDSGQLIGLAIDHAQRPLAGQGLLAQAQRALDAAHEELDVDRVAPARQDPSGDQ